MILDMTAMPLPRPTAVLVCSRKNNSIVVEVRLFEALICMLNNPETVKSISFFDLDYY